MIMMDSSRMDEQALAEMFHTIEKKNVNAWSVILLRWEN